MRYHVPGAAWSAKSVEGYGYAPAAGDICTLTTLPFALLALEAWQ